MKLFRDFTNFIFGSSFVAIYAAINHTTLPAMISKGQCTPAIILLIFMITTQGKKAQKTFLYPVKNSAIKNATETLAWSEGKLASGICSKRSFPAPAIAVSGRSMSTNC